MHKKYLVSVVCTGALILAASAGAVAHVEGTVETEVKVETNETNSRLDATNKGLDTKIDSTTELKTEIEVKDDGNDESTESVLPTVNKKTGAKVLVRGWDTVKKEAIQAKIDATIESNPEIKSVEVTENNVNIIYRAPAKFLGLFPGNFNLNVTADADARVKVKFPWYRFLLKTEFSNSAELLNGVFQHNQTDLEFLKAKASEEKQVEIFITISNSLKIMHDMSKSIIGNIKA